MQVKKIMACAASLLGRRDLCGWLEGEGGVDEDGLRRDAEQMLRCYNLTENEAALDYIPPRKREKVCSDGLIPFAALSHTPAEILAVYGESGEKLPFRVTEEGIAVRRGSAEVYYRARPAVKEAEDDSDYPNGERFLALGAACEFALMEGMLDRAAELDARYKDALAAAAKSKCVQAKARRWI